MAHCNEVTFLYPVILHVVLWEWEVHRLRVFENRKWWEAREDCIMRSFITCMLHAILLGWSSQGRWEGRASSTHGRDEKCIQNFSRKPEVERPCGRPWPRPRPREEDKNLAGNSLFKYLFSVYIILFCAVIPGIFHIYLTIRWLQI